MLTVEGLVRQHMALVYRERREYWGSAYIKLVNCAERQIAQGPHWCTEFVRYAAKAIHYGIITQKQADKDSRPRQRNKKRIANRQLVSLDPTVMAEMYPGQPFAAPSSLAESRDEHKQRVCFCEDIHRLPAVFKDAALLMLHGVDNKVICDILHLDTEHLRFVRNGLIEAFELGDHSDVSAYRRKRIIEARREGRGFDDIAVIAGTSNTTARSIWHAHCELTGEQDIYEKVLQMERRGKTVGEIEKATGLPITKILYHISNATNAKLHTSHRKTILGLMHHGWRYARIARFLNVSKNAVVDYVKRDEKRTGDKLQLEPYQTVTPQVIIDRILELAVYHAATIADIQAFVQIRRGQISRILKRNSTLLPKGYNRGKRGHQCTYGLASPQCTYMYSDEQLAELIAPLRRQFWSFERIAKELHAHFRRCQRAWFAHCRTTGEMDIGERLVAMQDSGVTNHEIAKRIGISTCSVSSAILAQRRRTLSTQSIPQQQAGVM